MSLTRPIALMILAGTLASLAIAQPAPTPAPASPTKPAEPGDPAAAKPAEPAKPAAPELDDLGRRKDNGDPIKLSFRSVTVEQVMPFIAESTGKAVLPQQDVLARTITVLSDRPVARRQALDLVFLALQQRGIAVIESDDIILLRDAADVDKQSLPVLAPDKSTLTRTDVGSIVQKVFALKHATASNVGEIIKNSLPDAKMLAVDSESNQVVVTAPIIILQRIERLINALDRVQAAAPQTETFKLQYADAEQIAQNIRDLYSATGQQGGQGQGGQRFPGQQGIQRQGGQGGQGGQGQRQGGAQSAATSTQLRVTANTQQNAVTVLAEAEVLNNIRRQIDQEWDKPLPETVTVPRVYDLQNTDPVKVKAVLEGLFGSGQGTTQQRTTIGPLAGQFTFQAVPDAGRLVVVSKSADNMSAIDKIIEELDKPLTSGLPEIVELKHATAEDLAEQLNALLARDGTTASIRRSDTSLSSAQTGTSPFAQDGSTTGTTNGTNNNNNNTQNAAGTMSFWWGQNRGTTTDNSGASNLIAKARIVPINRQNALMVLAPTEYRKSIVEMITKLDRPGRQVLIAAVVVELTSDDSTALGARFSNSAITPTRGENSIGTNANSSLTGTKNNVLDSLFDTSVLNLGVNINVLLQALSQKTSVKILSEPKIFTGDNQEAEFFDGQDIPFITESQPNTQGNLVQSFDYRAVGIQLRVRPRITPERDVDLKVNLQLSSITPGNTLFGGAIVDRRETTTQLIVADGQTMVISGIIRTEDSQIKRKIPILGDIPFFGAPFTSIENTKTNTELVAFITPIVVNNRTESEIANKASRERMKEIRKEMVPQDTTPMKPVGADPGPAE